SRRDAFSRVAKSSLSRSANARSRSVSVGAAGAGFNSRRESATARSGAAARSPIAAKALRASSPASAAHSASASAVVSGSFRGLAAPAGVASHSQADASRQAARRRRPSGDTASEPTKLACPENERRAFPVATSKAVTSQLSKVAYSVRPSGEAAVGSPYWGPLLADDRSQPRGVR